MSLLAKVDRFPPFICRLLARTRHGYHGLSHDEIALRSGLPKSTVADLSFKTSWGGVTVEVADKFSAACGVDFFRGKCQVQALLHRKKVYIYRGPAAQRAMYSRLFALLERWASDAGKVNGDIR